ncbi:MAG TPA: hypothetical protein VM934_16065 [Pyrinomonadaceae bacterium]|jgi:hypothetical protein|nr:hypothetical protein [Pyrinomonadaceae bacterium]
MSERTGERDSFPKKESTGEGSNSDNAGEGEPRTGEAGSGEGSTQEGMAGQGTGQVGGAAGERETGR